MKQANAAQSNTWWHFTLTSWSCVCMSWCAFLSCLFSSLKLYTVSIFKKEKSPIKSWDFQAFNSILFISKACFRICFALWQYNVPNWQGFVTWGCGIDSAGHPNTIWFSCLNTLKQATQYRSIEIEDYELSRSNNEIFLLISKPLGVRCNGLG